MQKQREAGCFLQNPDWFQAFQIAFARFKNTFQLLALEENISTHHFSTHALIAKAGDPTVGLKVCCSPLQPHLPADQPMGHSPRCTAQSTTLVTGPFLPQFVTACQIVLDRYLLWNCVEQNFVPVKRKGEVKPWTELLFPCRTSYSSTF